MHIRHTLIALLAIAVLLAGCATMTTPQTAKQRLAVADAQFAALVNAAADMHEQGVIDTETAESIDPTIQRGDRALDRAWVAIGRGNPETATDYIRVVNRTLIEIRSALEEAQQDERRRND